MSFSPFLRLAGICLSLGLLLSCQPDPAPSLDQLPAFFEGHMEENRIPGLAAAIVTPDSILWQSGFGYANLSSRTPMTTQHIQNIASVSKTFTATAIMQLLETGKLEMDADVNTYLPFSLRNPHFPETAITIRHLLTHTSSIVDGSAYGSSYACGDPTLSLKDWIEGYFQVEGAYFDADENFLPEEPGSTRQYSNVGYGLLGYVVEQVSGQSFSGYCKTHIFEPLGMTNTGWYLAEIDISKHAKTYVWQNPDSYDMLVSTEMVDAMLPATDSGHVTTCLYSFPNYPDGLLRTSVEDLSLFLRVWLNDGEYPGGRLLQAETVKEMFTPQLEGNEKQGLCWSYTGFSGVWGHGGNDPGVQTACYFDREKGVGMIIFQNADAGSRSEKLMEMYQAGLGQGC